MESSFDYLRAHAAELGSRILETYPPLQSAKDPVAPSLADLLRKPLPAQALAITGTSKYQAARIVAECGARKTYMALGTIHALWIVPVQPLCQLADARHPALAFSFPPGKH
jgi:hypothetical protein